MRAASSRDGTTISGRQALRLPTSMNSMKRTITGMPRKRSTRVERGVIVDAALDDGVDLDRREPGGDRGIDALQDLVERAESAAHAREYLLIQRIQTHRDALQAIGLQVHRMLASSTPLVVSAMSSISGYAGQIADQIGEIGAQQRFAAGEAQLAHAEAAKEPREAHDLLERQRSCDFRNR
jgi:hypothetical protein